MNPQHESESVTSSNAPNNGASAIRRRWRVGVVGAGGVSKYHLRSLRGIAGVEIVGLADAVPDRANLTASRFQIQSCFASLGELINAKSPDVIHILTPPSTHCALTIEALDAGCHVFVEKPMALSEEDCEHMIRKARDTGRVLSVDHSARFDPAVLRGLQMVRSGRIGTPVAVEYIRSSEYPPYAGGTMPEPFRDGGYPFRDLGVHALSVIEAFLGEIENVEGSFESSGRQIHLRYDEWQARVKCAAANAQIYLSWNSRPMQSQTVVHGTAGRLTIDSFLETCTLERALPGNKFVSLMWNGTAVPLAHATSVTLNAIRFATGRIGRAPDIQRSIGEFYSALSAGTEPPVSAQEGKRIVRWVEKIASPADEADCRSRPVSDRRPAEVLVTGAAGFLGRRLVGALLREGNTVRALVRRPSKMLPQNPLLRVVYGDLGQADAVDAAVKGVGTVFHVGAATDGGQEDYECGTIHGTRNVVDAALRHNAKVVHVSSLSVLDYVRLADGTRVDESTPLEQQPDKRGLYPKSKLEAERIILEGVARGLGAVIVRPGQIFGPGAEQTPPYGVFSVGQRWIVMGSGKMELPLVYVDDVVDALRKAASFEVASGSVFHIVDDQTITQQQYLDAYPIRSSGRTVTYVPFAVLYCGAVALQTLGRALNRSVPLTTYRLRALKGHLRFDCSAARRELDWTPRVGIAQGLKITFGGCDGAPPLNRELGRLPKNIRQSRGSEAETTPLAGV